MSDLDKDMEILKEIAEAIWCDGDVYLTEKHKQAIEKVIATVKNLEIVNCKILREKVRIIIEDREIIDNLKSELETYKKIAEKLAEWARLSWCRYGCCEPTKLCKHCPKASEEKGVKCIIDWARKEVEKDERR